MQFRSSQVFGILFIILCQTPISSAIESSSKIQQGNSLIQQGLQYLNRNQPNEALQLFEEAYSIYKDSNYLQGQNGSLINQSIVLKRMGQYYRACTILTKVLSLNHEICHGQTEYELKIIEQPDLGLEANQQIAALHNLGNNLLLLGQLEAAELALKQASSLDPTRHDITLSLANTYQAQYKDAIDQLSVSTDPASEAAATNKAQAQAQKAITLYESLASSSSHHVYAQLNALQLILHLGQIESPGLAQLHQRYKHLINPFIQDLLATDFNRFPEAEAVNLQLKLSGLLNELDQPTEAFHHARDALIKANSLQDFRLRSLAYGTLGKIYRQTEQLEDATKVFTKALKLAQASKEDNLAYQWSWQIAQIYQQQDQQSQAISAYDTSIKHLDTVRTMLISANSGLQFNYKESIEPVYTEYLQLLLSSPNPNLQLVLQTHQQLQVAELENFLKCGKLEAVSLDRPQQSENIARIHIFKLEDKIEVIVQGSEGLYRHQADSVAVNKNLYNFLRLINSQQFYETPESDIQHYAQALYTHLLAPIKPYLPQSGSLVFHLDSHFQNLPMALLHDGQSYLLKKYSLQTALNTQLRKIQPTGVEQRNVLFAGLSQVSPSFKQPNVPSNLNPLPEVEQELAGVTKTSNVKSSLLNDEFTTDRLQTALNQDTEIVHIASHGQFSSDPQQTFLLAYNEPIKAQKFHDLLNQKSDIGQASLELLILSACQTAKGDKRSTLGLAGLAIQAGSKNTLASLWLAESSSTAKLITLFYQGLKHNLPKAEALQQAQLKLMESDQYSHPYFWGNFILVRG